MVGAVIHAKWERCQSWDSTFAWISSNFLMSLSQVFIFVFIFFLIPPFWVHSQRDGTISVPFFRVFDRDGYQLSCQPFVLALFALSFPSNPHKKKMYKRNVIKLLVMSCTAFKFCFILHCHSLSYRNWALQSIRLFTSLTLFCFLSSKRCRNLNICLLRTDEGVALCFDAKIVSKSLQKFFST